MKLATTRLDPDLELEYRRYYLRADTGQIFLGVIIWLVSSLGFAYSDFLILGNNPSFWLLLSLRVSHALLCALVLVLLRTRVTSPDQLDRLVLAWGLATAVAAGVVGFLRPDGDLSTMVIGLVGVISFYVFISNRMSARVIPALLLTAADLYLVVTYRASLSGQVILALAFTFTISNMIGVVFSQHTFAVRRSEFLARREEARTQAELTRLASTDPLTGVFNRRRLLELANDAFFRYRRYQRPFSILVMDLDGFKMVNDTFGHQQGDVILIDFARSVTLEKREADALGRMGGDEFCLVLPETAPGSAVVLAERLLARCGDIRLSDSIHEVHVTVSIGITDARMEDTALDALFARADTALYQAKHDGRNRYHVV